jgi:hypothetical protein
VTGQRGRLAKLEARRREAEDLEVIGFFEADPDAGLWREMNTGQTRPMSPDEIEEARASGGGMLMLSPLPDRSRKLVYGVRAAEL